MPRVDPFNSLFDMASMVNVYARVDSQRTQDMSNKLLLHPKMLDALKRTILYSPKVSYSIEGMINE